MIPFFEKEVVTIHGWLSMERMLDMIAISQMTPGPLAINLATFVGYQTAGFWGSFFSTLGMITPSAVIIMIIATFFFKFPENSRVQGVLGGIRPIAVALVAAAVISVSRSTLIGWESVIILGIALAGTFLLRLHPIFLILLAGLLGILMR